MFFPVIFIVAPLLIVNFLRATSANAWVTVTKFDPPVKVKPVASVAFLSAKSLAALSITVRSAPAATAKLGMIDIIKY